MSALVAPSHTVVDRIYLGRRIEEIKKEKGGYYSNVAMAGRLGVHTDTLRMMLKGKREIYSFELDKMVIDLKLPVERILQQDVEELVNTYNSLMNANERTHAMLEQAQEVAKELLDRAVGATERGYCLNYLGRAYYLQKRYDEAHLKWLEALEFAKVLQEQYQDSELLHFITANLMLTYTIRKEYTNIESILSFVESAFPNDPDTLGMAYSTRMRVQSDLGNHEAAKQHAYSSLEHFEQTNNDRQIAHALINVAYCEFLLGEYAVSAEFSATAIQLVEHHQDILVLAVKNYIKTLMKLRDFKIALETLKKYENVALDFPVYWGKLQIMKTVLTDDPSFAEQVSCDSEMNFNIRYLACKCLFEYFLKRDDDETAVKYYKKGCTFSSSKTEFFEEEDF